MGKPTDQLFDAAKDEIIDPDVWTMRQRLDLHAMIDAIQVAVTVQAAPPRTAPRAPPEQSTYHVPALDTP